MIAADAFIIDDEIIVVIPSDARRLTAQNVCQSALTGNQREMRVGSILIGSCQIYMIGDGDCADLFYPHRVRLGLRLERFFERCQA